MLSIAHTKLLHDHKRWLQTLSPFYAQSPLFFPFAVRSNTKPSIEYRGTWEEKQNTVKNQFFQKFKYEIVETYV